MNVYGRSIIWCWLLCFIFMIPVQATALTEFQQAEKMLLAAAGSIAAYSDRRGTLTAAALQQSGWQVESYVQMTNAAKSKFLVARNLAPQLEEPRYLVAVAGTEEMSDIKVDLRVAKVYFAGLTPEEFDKNAERQNVSMEQPLVHKGFHQYVQAVFAATEKNEQSGQKEYLWQKLLNDKQAKVYMVGHSLGGAAVILGGARLLAMGVAPEQMEIITFGAPAVGNPAFGRAYGDKLNLTRVVMGDDPVPQVLQKLVGGYAHFGQEVRWKMPPHAPDKPHQMSNYFDYALRQYYDSRQTAINSGEMALPLQKEAADNQPNVYVLPPENKLTGPHAPTFAYMQEVLADRYRFMLPGYRLEQENGLSRAEARRRAEAQGCQFYIVTEIAGQTYHGAEYGYYVTLLQTVYRVADDQVVHFATYGNYSEDVTPLESFVTAAWDMHKDTAWLKGQALNTLPEKPNVIIIQETTKTEPAYAN